MVLGHSPPVRSASHYGDIVRPDLIPLSASSLVVGAMCLVLGSALNPSGSGEGASAAIRAVDEQSARWLGMALMYFGAAVALTLGLPALLSVFVDRGRRLGALAVVVFSVGVIGTAGYAMLMVFFRALVKADALRPGGLDDIIGDTGLAVFLYGWIAGFYVGVLLLALALFVARRTPMWSTGLLVVFVALLPLNEVIGRVGAVLQVMALAVAFTAIAIAAVNHSQPTTGQLSRT